MYVCWQDSRSTGRCHTGQTAAESCAGGVLAATLPQIPDLQIPWPT